MTLRVLSVAIRSVAPSSRQLLRSVCCTCPLSGAPSARSANLLPSPLRQSQNQPAVEQVGLDISASQVTAGSLSYATSVGKPGTQQAVEDIHPPIHPSTPPPTHRRYHSVPDALLPHTFVTPSASSFPATGIQEPRARFVVSYRQPLERPQLALTLRDALFCAWLGASF